MSENLSRGTGPEGDQPKTKQQRNQLSHVEFFKVCETMRNEEEWFKANKPTWVATAERLTKSTGLIVGINAAQAASEATGVTWELPARKSKEKGARLAEAEKMVLRLIEDNQKLHATLSALRGLVHELYWQLGADFPAGYQAPPDPRGKRQVLVNSKK